MGWRIRLDRRRDQGRTLQLGLPVTSVRDRVAHGDDLVIATHGCGIWVLDGVGPLPQANAAVAAAPTCPANASALPPKHIESLRWLSGALANLREAVEGADAAPSPDARDGLTKLSPIVEAALAAWERFVTTALPALNARLTAGGQKAIGVGA